MDHLRFDVVVIGSGGAGLRAAIEARLKGREVCVLTKATPGMGTSTILSAGAFSAAVKGGSVAEHRDWTLRAGRGLNDTDLVEVLIGEAPSRIDELVSWGMRGRAEAGQFVADGPPPVWGKEIVRALLAKARAEGVRFLGSTTACRLHVADGRTGIFAYNARKNEWLGLSARAVILATGGCSALYARHDNPHRMLGDGYALAFEAGADLKDMEFVQFYPWALAEKGLPVFVMWGQHITMGRVTDEQGQSLFDKYRVDDPPSKDSARDRFSQILFREVYREGHRITVDLTGVSKEEWCRDHFGRITWELVGDRFGAWRRPLHLAPAAHHTMGGVCIDAAGRTSLPGLFAAGEVTGGLHGANRLGGNALSDTLVFGARAGAAAADWAASMDGRDPDPPDHDTLLAVPDFAGKAPSQSGRSAATLKKRLQQAMWEDGGILRSRSSLERALETVGQIRRDLQTLHPGAAPKTGIQDLIELHHGTRTARLILQAALRREESRGAHFREDFAKPDDDRWRGHLRVRKGSDGTAEWAFAKG